MFETELVVREAGVTYWELVEPLIYRGAEDRFEVAAGFRTDFASVPRPIWPLIPRTGRYTKAAVVHDWLYAVQLTTRKDADGIFRRIARELGANRVRRWALYRGVRLGGWHRWNKVLSERREATSASP